MGNVLQVLLSWRWCSSPSTIQSRGKNTTQVGFTSSSTPLVQDQDSPEPAGDHQPASSRVCGLIRSEENMLRKCSKQRDKGVQKGA